MKYHILTLFPEMIEQGLHTSILGYPGFFSK